MLFDVDLEVDEGEIVALLGTNGAGKSTLLKAIAGLVEPSEGAIVFDGRDMTYTPPDETAGRGVTMVPGGAGRLPVAHRPGEPPARGVAAPQGQGPRSARRPSRCSSIFPILRERMDELGGNLSGGQQQMLTLGMAFIEKPRLLMIDELSLGLAPSVVAQLLEIVRELQAAGTTIILVEQSVNVALTVAETAYFMEKGEIRFHGPTAELLERPDVLRSVFLEGAGTHDQAGRRDRDDAGRPGPARPRNGDADAARTRARGPRPHEALRRHHRARRRVASRSARARSSASSDRTARARPRSFDVISGFTPQDPGTIMIRRHPGRGPRHHAAARRRCGPGSGSAARSRTVASSPRSP